ncbi:MAG: glycosyltransferase [Deltaproteobacteria bacterium]|nr:glycosyltransferase [Deltaproteobacteria bacterium]
MTENNKNNIPLVSVLIPVYNEAYNPLLSDTINSIIEQTYPNIELVLIDDASTDNSISIILEILNSHKTRFKRTRIIKNSQNMDIANSLNNGIKECYGEYIARLDIGDFMHRDRLSLQLEHLQTRKNVWLVGSFSIFIDEKKNLINRSRLFFPKTGHYSDISKVSLYRNFIPHSTWLIKKELFNKIGSYDSNYRCEDYEFWLRALSKNYLVEIIPRNLTYVLISEHAGISWLNKKTMQISMAKMKLKYINNFLSIPNIIGVLKTLIGLITTYKNNIIRKN